MVAKEYSVVVDNDLQRCGGCGWFMGTSSVNEDGHPEVVDESKESQGVWSGGAGKGVEADLSEGRV